MKFNSLKFITLILLIISLNACDSMISDVAAPESKPKLVVNGYISPNNDTLSIIIQESKPLYAVSSGYQVEYPTVTDAIVKITEGSKSIELIYNASENKYLAMTENFPIEAGKTYHLEVRTPRGELATANSTVPLPYPPEIEITNIESFNDYGNLEKVVSFRFMDLAGDGDFYRTEAGINYANGYPEGYYGNSIYFETGDQFVSDLNKEGEYFVYKTSRIGIQQPDQSDLFIYIAVTDENYFNYHRSISNFQGDNPFSEPTPIFTNITGGLGVFGAYTGSFVSVSLK